MSSPQGMARRNALVPSSPCFALLCCIFLSFYTALQCSAQRYHFSQDNVIDARSHRAGSAAESTDSTQRLIASELLQPAGDRSRLPQDHAATGTREGNEALAHVYLPSHLTGAPSTAWHVARSGSDTPDCGRGTGSAACASLAAVLRKSDSLLDGSTILIEPAPIPYDCPATNVSVSLNITSSSNGVKVQFDCKAEKQWVHFDGIGNTTRVVLQNLDIRQCNTSGAGGCVAANDVNSISIVNCSFSSCRAGSGGGCVSVQYTSESDGTEVLFRAIQIRDAESRNTGAISVRFDADTHSSAVRFTESFSCIGVSVTDGSGGCVSVQTSGAAENVEISFNGSTWMSNCSARDGGCVAAVYLGKTQSTSLAISGQTSLSNCRAESFGGCVAVVHRGASNNSFLTINGQTSMSNCFSRGSGGCTALYHYKTAQNSFLAITGQTTLRSCSAQQYGGCIALYYNAATKNSSLAFGGNTSMSGCSTSGKGGCVAVYHDAVSQRSSFVLSGHTLLSDCSAQLGGCISLQGRQTVHASWVAFEGEVRMRDCYAIERGGCVALTYDNATSDHMLSLRGSMIMSNCTAQAYGGCASLWYKSIIQDSSIAFSGPQSLSKCSAGKYGGCISIFAENVQNTSFTISGQTRMSSCVAGLSGGCISTIFLGKWTEFTFFEFGGDALMTDCDGGEKGGCVHFFVNGEAFVRHMSIRLLQLTTRNSVARVYGGAISYSLVATDTQNVTLDLVNVSIDTASVLLSPSYGGGISTVCSPGTVFSPPSLVTSIALWNQSCLVRMHDVTISNATANYGGAMDMQHGEYDIRALTLSNTSAVGAGGGIRVTGTASVKLRNSTLQGCATNALLASAIDTNCDGALAFQEVKISPPLQSSSIIVVRAAPNLMVRNVSVLCPPGYKLTSAILKYSLAMYPWAVHSDTCCRQYSYKTNCDACPKDTYALTRDSVEHPIQCLPVPYGAESPGGADVKARPGYWGTTFPTAGEITMYQCPEGYCCAGPAPCSPVSFCDRNRAGVLCGSCKPGYSQLYSSSGCAPDSTCGSQFFLPFALLFALLLALYYVYIEQKSFLSILEVVVGYYQLVPLLQVSTAETNVWEGRIIDLFNLRVPVHGSSDDAGRDWTDACPMVGLGVVGKLLLHLLVPVLVAAMLGVLYYVETRIVRREGARQRIGAAFILLTMLAYVTILESTFSLLHCVPVMGEKRMFLSGDVKCYQGWQIFLFVVVVLLYAFPFLLCWGQRSPTAWSRFLHSHEADARSKYREGCGWWEPITFIKRLLFVSVYVFVVDAYTRLMVLCSFCVAALLFHTLVMPYQDVLMNRVEILLLCASTVIALINLRSAVYVSSTISPEGPGARVTKHLQTAQTVLVAMPALLLCAIAVALCAKWRIGKSQAVYTQLHEIQPLIGGSKEGMTTHSMGETDMEGNLGL